MIPSRGLDWVRVMRADQPEPGCRKKCLLRRKFIKDSLFTGNVLPHRYCVIFFFFSFSPLPKLQDRAMPVKSLLKDVRSSNECNKAPAEATALTRPVLRDVRHRYVKLTSHQ